MRFLIVSDIHANWEALSAVLDDAAGAYDEVASCGDFVGYGADPNRVVEWTRGAVRTVIRGNHDKASAGLIDLEWFNPAARASAVWTHHQLSPENLEYIRSLPAGPFRGKAFDAVHGSPADEDEYLMTRREIALAARDLQAPLTFFGHTHLQGAFLCHRNGIKAIPMPARSESSRSIELEPDTYYMVNPGSVGQPRDGDPRAAYAVYDSVASIVALRRVAYAVSDAQAKIRKAGLSRVLADRLSVGR